MIDWFQAIVLALIQGLTEFLPISSSAHLILPSQVFGWPDQGLAFDVAVHVGTLSAVVLYLRQDIAKLAIGGMASLTGRASAEGRLAWMLVVATLPAAIAGLLAEDFIEQNLRSALVIAITTIAGALLLWWADRRPGVIRDLYTIGWRVALIIGCAQVLALVPGTSRSGITITAALLLGFERTSAARFSFLLSVPIIALSGGWQALQLFGSHNADWSLIALAALVSAVSAFACIHFFMKAIQALSMLPFVIYRLVLGILLLLFVV